MKIISSSYYNGLQINCGYNNKLPCYEEYLEKIDSVIAMDLDKHCKILMFRFDLRFPTTLVGSVDYSQLIGDFTVSLMNKLRYNELDPHYVWVREQHNSMHPHFHFLILLNGNKTQNTFYHMREVCRIWLKLLEPFGFGSIDPCKLIHLCNNVTDNLMIKRKDILTINKAFYWASYLAKVSTKTINPCYRSIGHSRIKTNTTLTKFTKFIKSKDSNHE